MSVLNQEGYDNLKTEELKEDAMAAVKLLDECLAGERTEYEFDKACECHINKPYVNKNMVVEHVLNSGDALKLFLIGLIPNMPKKSFMQKIIDTGNTDFIWKYCVYGEANLQMAIESLKEREAYIELFFLTTQHPKANKKPLNNLVKWMNEKDEQSDSVVEVSVWRDLIETHAKKLK